MTEGRLLMICEQIYNPTCSTTVPQYLKHEAILWRRRLVHRVAKAVVQIIKIHYYSSIKISREELS